MLPEAKHCIVVDSASAGKLREHAELPGDSALSSCEIPGNVINCLRQDKIFQGNVQSIIQGTGTAVVSTSTQAWRLEV